MMLGKRLKELREHRKLTQADVAKALGIDRTTYGKYETGDSSPHYEKLIQLADFFGVSVDYLIGKTDIPTPIETIAAHRTDDPLKELPEEARRSLEEFQEYILRKYGKKKD